MLRHSMHASTAWVAAQELLLGCHGCIWVALREAENFGALQVAIALSLLTAAVAKPPFNQMICTFSAKPQLHLVKGNTLVKQVTALGPSSPLQTSTMNLMLASHVSKAALQHLVFAEALQVRLEMRHTSARTAQVRDVSEMDWGMNTNVDAVFDLILRVLPSSGHI